MVDFNDILTTCQANVWPAMLDDLAVTLGLPPSVFADEAIGYYPAEQAWIIPERDAQGQVTGLLKRYHNGKKVTWKGSKRGLSYECMGICGGDAELPTRHFIRVSDAGVPCPVCGRENDGCLVSDEDPADPAAVICVRTPAGAVKAFDSGAGYLHHRHTIDGDRGRGKSVLPPSDLPIVVTEGWSDKMAAKAMGYAAIGCPSAGLASGSLCELVRGRDVILVVDRDPHGVGQRGMETVYQNLKPVCRSIVKVLPPEGFKDLRQWHPTGDVFRAHIATAGTSKDSGDVLAGSTPYDMIQEWLQTTQMKGNVRLFHHVNGEYFRWHGSQYNRVEQKQVRQEWYQFFAGREIKIQQANGVKIVAVKTDKHLMTDLDDAASALCYVRVEPDTHEPFVIKTGRSMDLTRAVVFQNGILHVSEERLAALSPDVFLTSTLPYEYRPGYQCSVWLWFVANVFNGDLECVALLQEWFGYNLIASNHMQSMMFFFGVPGSGKSTTGNVLRAVLGSARSCAAGTENFTALFGKESLLNKYAAIMSESRGVNRTDIDKLLQTWKAITGGDAVNVARKYKSAVDARLFCRLTYIANEAIPFDDASQAMANRMHLLYFPNNYRKSKPDWDLERKLRAEVPGIALWAIDGLKRLLATGQFTRPKVSMDHLTSLAELTNPIGTMLAECCRVHDGSEFIKYRTSCNDLYDLWKTWCDDNHVRTSMTSVGFGMKLKTMDQPIVRRQVVEAGNRFYAYQGLEILPSAYQRYLRK